MVDGGEIPDGIRPGVKKNLANFVGIVRKIRRAADSGTKVADLLHLVIEKTGYEQYLRNSQPDADSRWENVQELVSLKAVEAEADGRSHMRLP